MATLSLRRRVTFSAAHAYWLPDLSDDENRALFGKWASKWGHGHNYVVEATVTGEVNPADGMVVNIVDVDAVLKKEIVEALGDKHLSYEVPHFKETVPTLENIAFYIAERFQSAFQNPAARLTRLSVWEMPTLWATLDLEKNLVLLTRSFDFAASHRLHAPGLSNEENLEIFGKCNNPLGHGHNYGVEVTVAGDPDPVTGMIVDLEKLDAVLYTEIMGRFDHKNLNADTEEFRGVNPTSENLTLAIWKILEKTIPEPARLYRVIVKETDRNYFEYYGPSAG
jgi:6-pyruvoyltetrahydropterin/6-carboxytetrahydropterin synthase